MWEDIQTYIRTKKAVSDRTEATEHGAMYAAVDDGQVLEIAIPAKDIGRVADRFSVEPRALQVELNARGVVADDLGGRSVSEMWETDTAANRFWRLDATHDEVPGPGAIVEEYRDAAAEPDDDFGGSWGGAE